MRLLTWLLFLCLWYVPELKAQNIHRYLRRGDQAYDRSQYKQAEKEYRDAADHEFGNPKALYNLGNSLYQQGNWEDAAKRYQQAATAFQTPAEKSEAYHNLGNASMQLHQYDEAVKAYENSLRLHPGDQDAKSNLQIALKKRNEESQKNNQNKQDKDQNKKDQDQQHKDQQNGGDGKDQQQQNKQDQQDQQKNQPQQPGQQQPQQPEQQPQSGKMSREEAKRLLETAVGPDDQKNARKYRSAKQPPGKHSKKDW